MSIFDFCLGFLSWMLTTLLFLALCGCAPDNQYGVPGATGASGGNGSNGDNGYSAVFTTTAADLGQCPAGGFVFLAGIDINRNGVFDLTDANPQAAIVCNGTAGTNGSDGQDGSDGSDGAVSTLAPVDYFHPCTSGPYQEVILILGDGRLLASFSDSGNALNTRFAFIPDGSFYTTDSGHCPFSVSTVGNTRTASWSGGSKSWTKSY